MDLSDLRKQIKELRDIVANKKERFSELTGERRASMEHLIKLGLKSVKSAEKEVTTLKSKVISGKEDLKETVDELVDRLTWEEDDELLDRLSSEED